MNDLLFKVEDNVEEEKYICADLYFTKPNSGRFIRTFSSYLEAREFWNKEHNNYINLSVVHQGKILHQFIK